MLFSSLSFLFVFLPITLIGYYLCPIRLRAGFLLTASLIFYAMGEPVYVLLMAVSVASNWGIGLAMERMPAYRRALLTVSILLNLSLLFVFKYSGFVYETLKSLFPTLVKGKTPSIGLPIGISFFTFQIMSYIIDLYRGKIRVQKDPVLFGTYVTMFPQLIAGPIVRYVDIENQLLSPEVSWERIDEGIGRFVIGMAKKVLLANGVGIMWDRFSAAPQDIGALGAWTGLLAYTFQIYFDFSGYSDMACGLGLMLGFRFNRNFDYPYISRTVTEFWHRWHISLSTWFREYVYIPLGGNRKGKGRQAINLLIVWTLTGLWHGASWNFVLWGLYYGVLLVTEKFVTGRLMSALPRFAARVCTFLVVMLGWGIFAFTDSAAFGSYFGTLFGAGDFVLLTPLSKAWCLGYAPLLITAAVAATPAGARLVQHLDNARCFPVVRLAALALLFVLCIAALASQSYNPFIYFRF